MSMHEWPDDELDDLFRKSAEDADPATDPQDWRHLSERLSGHDQTRWTTKLAQWVLPTVLLFLLSIAGISWYWKGITLPAGEISRPSKQPESSNVSPALNQGQLLTKASRFQPAKPLPAHASRLSPESSSTDKPMNQSGKPTQPDGALSHAMGKSSATDGVSEGPKIPVNTGGTNKPMVSTRLANRASLLTAYRPARLPRPEPSAHVPDGKGTTVAVARANSHRLVAAVKQKDRPFIVPIPTHVRQVANDDQLPIVRADQTVSRRLRRNANPDASNDQDDDTTARFGIEQRAPEPAIDISQPNPTYLLAKPAKWPVTPGLLPVIKPVDTAAPERSAPQPRLSRLSIQLVISPDLSAIGFHNFDRPGSNVGVLGQYQLSDRFSLQTGALWSTKRYTTLASDYVWPVGAPASALRPESVTGRCTMFDIPLNLRYDMLLRPAGTSRGTTGKQRVMQPYQRWFVSGGVTSYFIDHEAYTYNYANPADPAIKRTSWDNKVEGKPGGSFGLSAINVSIGYERPVSQRFSLQIEPFLKVPVRQIGYFNVHLLSTGAFLSLRYRL